MVGAICANYGLSFGEIVEFLQWLVKYTLGPEKDNALVMKGPSGKKSYLKVQIMKNKIIDDTII